MYDQRFQDILAKHRQDTQSMLEEIAVTEQSIIDGQNKIKQLAEVKIPKDATLKELLALSDLLDKI